MSRVGRGRGDVRDGALDVLGVDLGLLGVRRGFGRLSSRVGSLGSLIVRWLMMVELRKDLRRTSVLFRSNSAELPTLTVLPTPFSQITYCKSAEFFLGRVLMRETKQMRDNEAL